MKMRLRNWNRYLMDEIEKKIRKRLRDDFEHYASKCLKIRSKSGDIQNFQLNKAQKYIHDRVEQQRRETGKIRAIILKGRQQGVSTLIEGRFYWRVTHRFGVRAFILTHDTEATNNLFDMANRYYDHCPKIVRPSIQASNAKELIFAGLDSGYKLGTAGNKAVGRSSTIQFLHGSEVGFWPNASEHAKGILQAVPNEKDTEIFLESTANGIGNYFHEQWQMAEAGQSEFIPIFVPWYWQEEYKKSVPDDFKIQDDEVDLVNIYGLIPEQILWRRSKVMELSVGGMDGVKAFHQEYPNTAQEAFQSTGDNTLIDPLMVMRARKTKVEEYGNLVIGVDPARYGDDRTSIIFRRGRRAFNLQSYSKKDNMEITGIVHRLIIEYNPTRVFIDIGGGAGIYDRLKELGHGAIIVSVNFGSIPLNQKRYSNKRAEMWGLMNEWLQDEPVEIPDKDTLHADLCGVHYRYDSNSRLILEKKEDMKARGIRSPDEADALALTFAMPDKAIIEANKQPYDFIAKDLAQSFYHRERLKKNAYSK